MIRTKITTHKTRTEKAPVGSSGLSGEPAPGRCYQPTTGHTGQRGSALSVHQSWPGCTENTETWDLESVKEVSAGLETTVEKSLSWETSQSCQAAILTGATSDPDPPPPHTHTQTATGAFGKLLMGTELSSALLPSRPIHTSVLLQIRTTSHSG